MNSTRAPEAARRGQRGERAPGRSRADARRRCVRATSGHERQRLDQHVDALPGIEVPGVGDDRPRRRAARSTSNGALGGQPRAVGDDRDARAAARTDRRAPRRAPRSSSRSRRRTPRRGARARSSRASFAARRRGGARVQRRHQRRHRRRVAVRLVDQRRTPGPRQPRQQRRDAEVAREDHVGPRRRQAAARRRRRGSARGAAAPVRRPATRAMVKPSIGVEAVERQRIARLGARCPAAPAASRVPARGQRVTRRDRLHAVGALERQPDVGEVEQVHGALGRRRRRRSRRGRRRRVDGGGA